MGCAGGTLSGFGTCLLPDSLAILPYTTAILSFVFVGSEIRVPETGLEIIKNLRGLAMDDTLSDEEVTSIIISQHLDKQQSLRLQYVRRFYRLLPLTVLTSSDGGTLQGQRWSSQRTSFVRLNRLCDQHSLFVFV